MPHYSAQPMRFGSHGTSEFVSSSWIRHPNPLTEKDWADAVQGLGTKQDKDIVYAQPASKETRKKNWAEVTFAQTSGTVTRERE